MIKLPPENISFVFFKTSERNLKTIGFNSTYRSQKSQHRIGKFRFIPMPTSMNKVNIEIRHLTIVHKTKKRNTPKNLK